MVLFRRLRWTNVNGGAYFHIFLEASIYKIDQIITDIIPGIYRSGALISYLGATGSDLLYWTDQF